MTATTSDRSLHGWLLLACAIGLGVALRLVHVADPTINDFHAWRQADTAAFTRGYLVDTPNLLQASLDRFPCHLAGEPFGRVESELPLVAWLAAMPLRVLGVEWPPPWYLRAWSIAFFALGCLYLHAFVGRLGGAAAVRLAAVLAFSLLPLSVYFTRTIQPDGPALCLALAFLFHLDRWARGRRGWDAVGCAAAGAAALALKTSYLHLGIVALALLASGPGLRRALRDPAVWALGLAVLLPPALWYAHARSRAWSFGLWGDVGISKFSDFASVADPDHWQTLVERLTSDIYTWPGLILLVSGLFLGPPGGRCRLVAGVWLAAVAVFIAATLPGNIRHIYYQLPLVAPGSIAIALGAQRWLQAKAIGHAALAALVAWHAAAAYRVLWGERSEYYRPDPSLREGAELVARHVPGDERIVSTDRHPALFFNGGRRGWFTERATAARIADCLKRSGARYLLLDDEGQRALEEEPHSSAQLRSVAEGGHYALWRLRQRGIEASPRR